jgi:hypothetical protein
MVLSAASADPQEGVPSGPVSVSFFYCLPFFRLFWNAREREREITGARERDMFS